MSGTKAGGKKTSATIRRTHGSDYWAKIGSIGGQATGKKGFAVMPREKVSAAGRTGGTKSRRGKAIKGLHEYPTEDYKEVKANQRILKDKPRRRWSSILRDLK